MYCVSQLIVLKPFSCILVKQGLNYSNIYLNKNNPVQATYFIIISSPSPLLVILTLIYIRNPFNLYTFFKKCSTEGILIIIIICSCLMSDAVPIQVHADKCRQVRYKKTSKGDMRGNTVYTPLGSTCITLTGGKSTVGYRLKIVS